MTTSNGQQAEHLSNHDSVNRGLLFKHHLPQKGTEKYHWSNQGSSTRYVPDWISIWAPVKTNHDCHIVIFLPTVWRRPFSLRLEKELRQLLNGLLRGRQRPESKRGDTGPSNQNQLAQYHSRKGRHIIDLLSNPWNEIVSSGCSYLSFCRSCLTICKKTSKKHHMIHVPPRRLHRQNFFDVCKFNRACSSRLTKCSVHDVFMKLMPSAYTFRRGVW